jgi:hypothetical protein
MSILNNAIESIQIGVEDFRSEDKRRQLSAVRNVVAGILLLYKDAKQRAKLSRILGKKALKSFHPEIFKLVVASVKLFRLLFYSNGLAPVAG